ncbi:reverse transcriptase domain-containing protein [Tanacetum coccineum]
MHIRCGRGSILGPRGHHERNQGLSRESKSGDEVTIHQTLKEAQSLNRKLSDFQWTPEAERAFQDMKQCIVELPMVTVSRPKEELIMYLCAAREVISAVLLAERDSQQIPVYFVSRALQTPEINYNSMEKVVLALVHATRRLRWYFQAYLVVVITDQPIKQILSRSEHTRRMLKWKFELEAFDITYRPRTSIRDQILADFIAKRPDEEGPPIEAPAEEKNEKSLLLWKKRVALIEYLAKGTLPAETKKARAIKIKARQYTMINGVLYKKSFLEPWLQRVGPIQAEYVVKEIHEGSYSMHSSPRSVVVKAIRSGYYWPTIHKDARNIIRKYSGCQEKSYPTTESSSGTTHSKTGAKSSTSSKGSRPSKHPQTNGQVEKGNYSLGEGIKARLGEDKKNWVEEVLYVSWAHRTMIKTSNGNTPFSLTYGTEAVIPVEIGMPSLRCAKVNQAKNDEGLLLNLDILEERREKAVIREAKSKAKMEKYYNAKVHSTTFRPGDFVYRSNEASQAKESGKLGPKWEGSYEVVECT